jgi:hypothetical protein
MDPVERENSDRVLCEELFGDEDKVGAGDFQD